MFHLADLGATFGLSMLGACHVFIPMFHPEQVFHAIKNEKVTVTMLVPTMINSVLNNPNVDNYDLSSLRRLVYGASPMPVELLKAGITKVGTDFHTGYGMTETSPLLTVLERLIICWKAHPNSYDDSPRVVKKYGVEVRVVRYRR